MMFYSCLLQRQVLGSYLHFICNTSYINTFNGGILKIPNCLHAKSPIHHNEGERESKARC